MTESADATELTLRDWPRAFGPPPVSAVVRAEAEDFRVEECPAFEPGGSGVHAYLWLEKRHTNTDWLAGEIARLAGVPRHAVGYAGLKDRRAVTRQWFSVDLSRVAEPDWQRLAASGDVTVLRVTRHTGKLRRGALRGNRFELRLRDVVGDSEALEARLARVARDGVPNYYGEQRFGHAGGNLKGAAALLLDGRRPRDRQRAGLYLSAARSALFNTVLAARVAGGSWTTPLAGEACLLDGTRRYFVADAADDALLDRARAQDIHPTGPLCGGGEAPVRDAAADVEHAALAAYARWTEALAAPRQRLRHERRALRLPVRGLAWDWEDPATLRLTFELPAGSYATAVLRELADTRSPTPDAEP